LFSIFCEGIEGRWCNQLVNGPILEGKSRG
jgi:hypothetical protein